MANARVQVGRQTANARVQVGRQTANARVQVGRQTKAGVNFCAAKTHGYLAFWLTFPKG